ncbi:hypothetical protein DICVIV_00850 [Dictyocaulus viviparus]|uniref:SSD domain-containing protein n=1 Tax=Dictyocaulus viviparus TaxID=29172 RepID=A0A0D8YEC5_DICVI|nr:hypothetical protein DICVIV_00850 [Dictyocaulus viviparus]
MLRTTNRIQFANKPPLIRIGLEANISSDISQRDKRSWTEQLLNAFNKFPCYEAPIPLMNHLTQVVIEVPSLDTIFQLDFLVKICSMHESIAKELSAFDDVTPYRNIWSIANFISCLSPNFLLNCTELSASDVELVKELVNFCIPYREQLIQCKVACKQTCSFCEDVPQNCTSTMMFDLFYRLLPRDLNARPLHLNTFLPVFTLTGYATQNIFVTLNRYDDLEQAIVRFMDVESIPIKGISMDIKRDRLLPAAMADSLLALLAALVVGVLIAVHSRSPTYAFAVFLVLALSVTGSLAFYSLFTAEFPLLNLVIFVLLIAVGTDDAFLLLSHFPSNLTEDSFHEGRYVWLAGLSTVAIFMSVVSVKDLHLPEYNPLQLFISSNPHEWYDNNAEKLFAFVEEKIAIPLFIRLVWGVKGVRSTATFQTYALTPLESDPSFSLMTSQDVQRLADTLASYRKLPFINYSNNFWPEKFLNWSAEYPCVSGFVCCNISHPMFNDIYMDYCLRNSTYSIGISYNDTPLFDSNSLALIGYTALLPTQLTYSHRFHHLEHSFTMLAALSPPGGWWAPEWALISTWYDLQRSIVHDVRSSVVVSISVVALFSLLRLKMQAIAAILTCVCIIVCSTGCVVLLGWEIGVLEAVIVVLVVGLSFDYTLHYGAALPSTGCKSHRIIRAANLASVPVSLSALTSFLAGASMLFTQTHAFSQVGVFLIVLTITSWIFATFFFLPLLFFSLSPQKDCDDCAHSTRHSFQLDEKIHS